MAWVPHCAVMTDIKRSLALPRLQSPSKDAGSGAALQLSQCGVVVLGTAHVLGRGVWRLAAAPSSGLAPPPQGDSALRLYLYLAQGVAMSCYESRMFM